MSLNQESANTECPICFDDIDQLKNCVTTVCGHIFHCSCLMKNAVNNGFTCPMCRNVMAEELESESEFESDVESEWSNGSVTNDDDALTSFRMFHQQLNNEEVEPEPEPVEAEEEEVVVDMAKPNPEFIAGKLIAQGITITDLVKTLLVDHEEYDEEYEEYEIKTNQLFGALRIIITNYSRQPQTEIDRFEKAAKTQEQVTSVIVNSELQSMPTNQETVIEKILIVNGQIVDGRKTARRYFGSQSEQYIM
jgi:hypothetical protein